MTFQICFPGNRGDREPSCLPAPDEKIPDGKKSRPGAAGKGEVAMKQQKRGDSAQGQQRKGLRIGLGTRLNLIQIAGILLVSVGLVLISYNLYCRKVDSLYFEEAERAANVVGDAYLPYTSIPFLRSEFETEEFREVRARAVAEDDDSIIENWMRNRILLDNPEEVIDESTTEEEMELFSLWGEYQFHTERLKQAKEAFGVKSVYIQYVENGVTYNLVDPDERLTIIGQPEEAVQAFAKYEGNERIPATIYQYKGQWLCTACEPIEEKQLDGSVIQSGQFCVDLDMNDVFEERRWFRLNSILLIAGVILVAVAGGLLITRKKVTKPLKMLSDGATGFVMEEEGYSPDRVISLPIRSNDEIGDLYDDIRRMQEHIVDDTVRLRSATAERERIGTELRMATEIQRSMLPCVFPPFPDRKEIDLYASMDPAKAVGGDFYDFFLIDEDHLALLIADVSDKGVPAALFMMSAKILINYRAQMGGTPGEILTAVNQQISKDNHSMMFVTVWMGILDLNTGVLTCSNAGHEYPAIRSGNGVFRVFRDKHGIMVGARKKAQYTDYELKLEPGDAVFVYTDGIPEARNDAGEMYGMGRLEAALRGTAGQTPEEILKSVRADVDAFVGGADQFDDLTMLCLEYKGK